MGHVNIILEIINIVFCIRFLLDEKIKMDFRTVILIVIDLLVFQMVNMYELKNIFRIVLYPVIIMYCWSVYNYYWQK